MGLLKRLDDWITRWEEKKNQDSVPKKNLLQQSKNERLGKIEVQKRKCPKCKHHKMFRKPYFYKCTKCGYKENL